VIVRISTEAQYDVDDAQAERLNELDNAVVAAVEAGNESNFHELYDQMIELVRSQGRRVPDEDLVESAVILPPPDLSFAEAGEQFSGDGILPG
jgi:hypothetical protein